jgi:hypothetical protein
MLAAKNLKVVTFDFIGTIAKFREPPHRIYKQVAERRKIYAVDQKLKAGFDEALKIYSERWPNFGAADKKDAKYWWKHVYFHAFTTAGIEFTKEKIMHDLYEEIWEEFSGIPFVSSMRETFLQEIVPINYSLIQFLYYNT